MQGPEYSTAQWPTQSPTVKCKLAEPNSRSLRLRARSHPDISNYDHVAATRKNIPTAELQSFLPDDEKNKRVLLYLRNADLDPQLVWRGKDPEDSAPLEVAAPPVYIQEKIHPRALIEDLRKQSARRRNKRAEQTDLFHDFNGLPKGWVEDAAASYYHDEGLWQNRMILKRNPIILYRAHNHRI